MTKPTRPTVPDISTSPGSGDAFPVGGRPSDPQILCYVSPDGGMSWHAMPQRSLGAIGVFRQRIRWHRLGSGYNVVLRFVVSDPVPFAALALEVE